MIAAKLPAVLAAQGKQSGIAVYRALKQILEILENHTEDGGDEAVRDRINASIDDVQVMMERVE